MAGWFGGLFGGGAAGGGAAAGGAGAGAGMKPVADYGKFAPGPADAATLDAPYSNLFSADYAPALRDHGLTYGNMLEQPRAWYDLDDDQKKALAELLKGTADVVGAAGGGGGGGGMLEAPAAPAGGMGGGVGPALTPYRYLPGSVATPGGRARAQAAAPRNLFGL